MKETCWILTGPTATGKTSMSIRLAEKFGCEIICMDSMQIYRGMDIGTAKPTREEMHNIPHHMLDIQDPHDSYSVAQYVDASEKCAAQILGRGKIPLFVGGTGFYLRALRHPMGMGNTPKNDEIRCKLQAIADEPGGNEILHARLGEVDRVSAERLPVNDTRRVIRALEVYELTGIPFSEQKQSDRSVPFEYKVAVLNMERSKLYDRINTRVDQMIEMGLVDEVRRLIESGVSENSQAMKGIGYKEIVPYIHGKCTMDEAIQEIKQNTRHYAKRQLTWMRAEENVLWVDALDEGALTRISKWFEKKEEM